MTPSMNMVVILDTLIRRIKVTDDFMMRYRTEYALESSYEQVDNAHAYLNNASWACEVLLNNIQHLIEEKKIE